MLKLKNLRIIRKRKGSRNNLGRITVRHRGGGVKLVYRQIDYKRSIWFIQGNVIRFYKDKTRSVNLALICYQNGIVSYISEINGLKIGDFVMASNKAPIVIGNALSLKNIPIGSLISNIEIFENQGAQLLRSAGMSARLVKKDYKLNKATISLLNHKRFEVNLNCIATLGSIGNSNHKFKKFNKAGDRRKLGYRPKVRGVAMNPVDHPMGGGEGKTSGGRCSVSPWGKFSKGGRTKRNFMNKFNLVKNEIKMEA